MLVFLVTQLRSNTPFRDEWFPELLQMGVTSFYLKLEKSSVS